MQTIDRNVDYHVYPSGKQVIKAFTANDFQFFDKNSQVITELSDTSIEVVDKVHITWRIQKNPQNNQTVTLLSDKTNTAICPVLAAVRIPTRNLYAVTQHLLTRRNFIFLNSPRGFRRSLEERFHNFNLVINFNPNHLKN